MCLAARFSGIWLKPKCQNFQQVSRERLIFCEYLKLRPSLTHVAQKVAIVLSLRNQNASPNSGGKEKASKLHGNQYPMTDSIRTRLSHRKAFRSNEYRVQELLLKLVRNAVQAQLANEQHFLGSYKAVEKRDRKRGKVGTAVTSDCCTFWRHPAKQSR